MKLRKLEEKQGIGQLLRRVADKETFAIIGSKDRDDSRIDHTEELDRLVAEDNYKYGSTTSYAVGNYEMRDTKEVVREDSIIVYHITKDRALSIARKVNQESIIWSEDGKIGFLYCDDERFEPFKVHSDSLYAEIDSQRRDGVESIIIRRRPNLTWHIKDDILLEVKSTH